jgi:hypothetical protein
MPLGRSGFATEFRFPPCAKNLVQTSLTRGSTKRSSIAPNLKTKRAFPVTNGSHV